MTFDETGKLLHDRATRGEMLSAEEQAQLHAWYSMQDQAESAQLGLAASADTITVLQAQLSSALAQLTTATSRIQELAAENDALRQENAALRRQLANRASPQPV